LSVGLESISLKFLEAAFIRTKFMDDEHIVSVKIGMQFLQTRVPVIVLRIPSLSEIIVKTVCLGADKRIISSNFEDFYGPKTKRFLGIMCYFSFSVVSDFCGDFLCP